MQNVSGPSLREASIQHFKQSVCLDIMYHPNTNSNWDTLNLYIELDSQSAVMKLMIVRI